MLDVTTRNLPAAQWQMCGSPLTNMAPYMFLYNYCYGGYVVEDHDLAMHVCAAGRLDFPLLFLLAVWDMPKAYRLQLALFHFVFCQCQRDLVEKPKTFILEHPLAVTHPLHVLLAV